MFTTRKNARSAQRAALRACLLSALAAAALCGGGCATPGPTHVYLAGRADAPIIDLLPGSAESEIPAYLAAVNELYGMTYDPFTDHLFLRIFPGDFVRVIDRPARRIKRSFYVDTLPPGRGDLAIRSRDRHLFFVHPSQPALIETNLNGRFVRTVTLENLQSPPAGVAYDQKNNRLLVLQGGDLARVSTYDLSGKRLSGIGLDRNVRLSSLAYDSSAGELYVPLLDDPGIGIFDLEGRLLRTLPSPDGTQRDYIDVGQRSLLRLF